MGSVNEVAREKGAIYEGLSADGVAVINADDAFAGYWKALNAGRAGSDLRPVRRRRRDRPLHLPRFCQRPGAHHAPGRGPLPPAGAGLHNVRNAPPPAAGPGCGASLEAVADGLGITPARRAACTCARGPWRGSSSTTATTPTRFDARRHRGARRHAGPQDPRDRRHGRSASRVSSTTTRSAATPRAKASTSCSVWVR